MSNACPALLPPDYMTAFQCNFPGATGKSAVAKGKLPRRCGADPANGRPHATPKNCTVGAMQPFYWYQAERNNVSWPFSLFALWDENRGCSADRTLDWVDRCSRARTRHLSIRTCTGSRMVPRTRSSRTAILPVDTILIIPRESRTFVSCRPLTINPC